MLLCGAIVLLAVVLSFKSFSPAFGSTGRGSEYQATTTVAVGFTQENLVQTGNGTLGSVVITGAAAGTINIYDATTSNVALRTGQPASSTILLASFPLSAAAGTYTFDRVYFTGLYISIVGAVPTSTITFR